MLIIIYDDWKEFAQEAINNALDADDFKKATEAAVFLAQIELAHKYSMLCLMPIQFPPTPPDFSPNTWTLNE